MVLTEENCNFLVLASLIPKKFYKIDRWKEISSPSFHIFEPGPSFELRCKKSTKIDVTEQLEAFSENSVFGLFQISSLFSTQMISDISLFAIQLQFVEENVSRPRSRQSTVGKTIFSQRNEKIPNMKRPNEKHLTRKDLAI